MLHLLLLAFTGQTWSQLIQRYNTFSYGVNEGLLQTTIYDIEIDRNNFCWVSFPNGIRKFDGSRFTPVPVQAGLPDDRFTRFFRCANNDLLISHSTGISRYNIATDNFTPVYTAKGAGKSETIIIGEEAGVLYFFDGRSGMVTAMNSTDFKVLYTFKTGITGSAADVSARLRFSENLVDGMTVIRNGSLLSLVDLKNRKLARQTEIDGVVYSFILRMKNRSEVFYVNGKEPDNLRCHNFETNSDYPVQVKGKDNSSISRCVMLPWKDKTLISFNNRIFETDSTLSELKAELVNFQNQPVAGAQAITQIKEDNFGNLYLQTVNGGIRKIIRHTYPIKYFGTADPAGNTMYAILPDKKNNRILTGGSAGLLVFDTLQHLVKRFAQAPGTEKKFSPNGIIPDGNGGYIIFAVGLQTAFFLDKNLHGLMPVPIYSNLPPDRSYIQFFGNPIINTGTWAVFQSQEKLYRVDLRSHRITEHEFSQAYIMAGHWQNKMIISHDGNELIYLDGETFREIRRVPFFEPNGLRCITTDDAGFLYAGGNNGIFKLDANGKILRQWNKSTGLPDECIYSLAFDNTGAIWCSTNKGVLKINTDNQVLQITKQDGLQENEFNTNVLAVAADGEMYFGGTNGVSSFYPATISSVEDPLTLLFTGIRANSLPTDTSTAPWNINRVQLNYRQNALSFDFIVMGNYNPDQYVYQYKMENVDDEWIQNNEMQTVRYSLSPGRYVFKVSASRSFNKDAIPLKEIYITIRPPVWQQWWFRAALLLFASAILYYFINQRNKRIYAVKLQKLEQEQEIKKERERISKDLHDSLGAYANAVLYNTELLAGETSASRREELITDLNFASKDIITALRETVWALKNETYTAEECLVRIRNFIQPFARYYSHIQFAVEGEAPETASLHYTRALHLVRIVQEAVTNSIKHADPSIIKINSHFAGSSWVVTITDNGKGFDYSVGREAERGNGIANMKHRATEAGFELQIDSKLQEGTIITVTTNL